MIRCLPGTRGWGGRALVALLLLALPGCQSVRTEPFGDFSTALLEVRKGADEALRTNAEWARDRFASEVVRASQSEQEADLDLVTGLLLEVSAEDPFVPVVPEEQLYLRARRFHHGVDQLNAVFITYGELLFQLAAPSLVPRERFEQMARDLDANAGAALEALGVTGVDAAARGFASLAAAEGARLFIEWRRRSYLEDTLREAQPIVEDYSDRGREAVRIAVRHFRHEYEQRSAALAIELTEAAASQRRRKAQEIMALNELYLERMAVFRSLDLVYRRLPLAHSELLGAVEGERGFAAIVGLFEEGRRLVRLAESLEGLGR